MKEFSQTTVDLPEAHRRFLAAALPRLQKDERLVAVAAGGSFRTNTVDEYSDVDLVIAVAPVAVEEVMAERKQIAARLGKLLVAFTGEHVGEPRLLVCLYDDPLLHVDLKFVRLPDAADRVEDPVVLWERDGCLSDVLQESTATFPQPDLQWIEDRFWAWVHYIAGKIGRGELFEAHDSLALLRMWVLGPLALQERGARPAGVRKIEIYVPEYARAMERTVAAYDDYSCAEALTAAADLYRTLRAKLVTDELCLRHEAEEAALTYLGEIKAQVKPGGQ